MYQNGKRVNRYAAKKYHQAELKRKFTPINYASYDSYCESQQKWDAQTELWLFSHLNDEAWERHLQKEAQKVRSGRKDHYQKWWKHWYGFISKKNLKHEAKKARRVFYRKYCYDILSAEDVDDIEISPQTRFGNPWNWD